MQEEIKTTPEQDYIDTINQMKENMIDKKSYDKLREDNRKLLNSLMSSGKVENTENLPKLESSQFYIKNIKDADKMTNLEYISNALNLRDAILQEKGKDIFTLPNQDGDVSEEQRASAERTADVLKQLCEQANGDAEMFRVLYQKRIIDPAGIRIPKR